MADQKMSQFAEVTSMEGTDEIPLIRAGANKRIKAQNMDLGGVETFNGRSGSVVLQSSDLNGLNGSGLTGLAGATGGVVNTGSTTIGADSDDNGTGVIDFQIGGVSVAQIDNEGKLHADIVGGAGSGIDVASFATSGDGTEANPWRGWSTAITWTARKEYHFKSGWFAFTTSPNYLHEDIAITGEAGTYLKHEGTGDAFTLDSGAPAVLWIQRARIENLTIVGHYAVLTGTAGGNASSNQVVGSGTAFLSEVAIGDAVSFQTGMNTESRIVTAIADNTHLTVDNNWSLTYAAGNAIRVGKTRYGINCVGLRNMTMRNVSVKDVAVAALRTQNNVTDTFEDFVCTYHEPTQLTGFVIRPQYMVILEGDTTTQTFIEPVWEGAQIAGAWFKTGCYGNTLINGTSEGNKGKGIIINSEINTIINTDFEANGDTDIEITQSGNKLINVLAAVELKIAAGQRTVIDGCTVGNIINDGDFTQISNTLIGGTVTGVGIDTMRFFGNMETLTPGVFRHDSKLGNVLQKFFPIDSATTINTDARAANIFGIVLAHNTTLANPTNAVNGQVITWRFTPTGSQTIAFGNKFRTATSKEFPTLSGPGQPLYIVARYHATDDRFDIIYSNNEVFSTFEASDISARDINATGAFYVDDVQVLTNQQPAITNPTGGTTVDTECRAATASILTTLRNHGLIAVTAPFNLANTIGWFPAWSLTFNDNAAVNKWRDRSGNIRHLAQSDPAKRPIFKTNQVNGLPCVRFDGVNDYLISGAFAYNQPICISLVIKRYNNAFKYLYSSIDGAGVSLFQGDGASSDEVAMYAGTGSGDPKGVIDSGAWYLVTAEYNTTSSKIYENGVQVGSTGNPGSNNGNGLILGNRFDLSVPCQMDCAEAVIYLTSERSNVETYLLDQYNF